MQGEHSSPSAGTFLKQLCLIFSPASSSNESHAFRSLFHLHLIWVAACMSAAAISPLWSFTSVFSYALLNMHVPIERNLREDTTETGEKQWVGQCMFSPPHPVASPPSRPLSPQLWFQMSAHPMLNVQTPRICTEGIFSNVTTRFAKGGSQLELLCGLWQLQQTHPFPV